MIDIVRVLRETHVARAEHHPTVGSTNDLAAQIAAQGAKELPLLVVADQQTAGRGHGANRWWTGAGSLAFSLLVDAETVAAAESRSPLVALAVAVAVAETVAPLLPSQHGKTLGIHWPNDVMVGGADDVMVGGTDIMMAGGTSISVCPKPLPSQGRQECLPHQSPQRKLSGILVEVLPDRRHVVGVGVNTNNTAADAPAELQSAVATLRDLTGKKFDQTDVLVTLVRRMEQEFLNLRNDATSAAARADQWCLDRGRTLTLESGNRKITGLCRGIAADGSLRLETAGGEETFCSGVLEPA